MFAGQIKKYQFFFNKDPDKEALFTAIFREHEYKLYMLVLRLTKSDQYAKDIIQEVFLKLWAQWDHAGNRKYRGLALPAYRK